MVGHVTLTHIIEFRILASEPAKIKYNPNINIKGVVNMRKEYYKPYKTYQSHLPKEESCVLCGSNHPTIGYKLVDGSEIQICGDCGAKLYNHPIVPVLDTRLFHIIALMKYIADLQNET